MAYAYASRAMIANRVVGHCERAAASLNSARFNVASTQNCVPSDRGDGIRVKRIPDIHLPAAGTTGTMIPAQFVVRDCDYPTRAVNAATRDGVVVDHNC